MLAESEALQEIKHPFVMVMHGAFQDTQSFYFVLECAELAISPDLPIMSPHLVGAPMISLDRYLPGGDLFEHVQRHCVFSVEWSRFYAAQVRLSYLDLPDLVWPPLISSDLGFYAAQVALALDCVHSLGYVYRDLKLENVMIDAKGNAKLGDFGLAKKLEGGSPVDRQSMAGTRLAMASDGF